MNSNVGGIDRVLRIIVGIIIIAWGVYTQNRWGAIGVVPLVTGFIRWCPAYLPFGLNSCKVKDER
ncbi:MAG: hypothetical protein COA95_06165 [Methylophaga sp.]|nr:MAG: hypothetical protein COA95_06165 [Methylophaga sp.]